MDALIVASVLAAFASGFLSGILWVKWPRIR